ncbi:MAG: hypothetical protein M0R03_20735, partial [Novosphingobium sp.]|nr:hypothetical protein [Novosphingobium sp.]
LSLNVINKYTKLILVEQKKKNIPPIQKFVKKHNLNATIHYGPIEKFDLRSELKGAKVDFMFFDICGNITARVAYWFKKHQDCFSLNMRIPTTLAIHHRIGNFKKAISKITNDITPTEVEKLLFVKNNAFAYDFNKKNIRQDVLFNANILFYAFDKREIEFDGVFVYNDTRTVMTLFEIRIKGDKEKNDTLDRIIEQYDSTVSYQSQIIRRGWTKKEKKIKDVPLKNAYQIARRLGIFGHFKSFESIPSQKRSWIKIAAKKHGIDPEKAVKKVQKRLEKYGLLA